MTPRGGQKALLAVESRLLDPTERALMGSASGSVVRHARCFVPVARRVGEG